MDVPLGGGLNAWCIGLLLLDSLRPFLTVDPSSFSGVTVSGFVFDSCVLRGAVTGGIPALEDDRGGLGIAECKPIGRDVDLLL